MNTSNNNVVSKSALFLFIAGLVIPAVLIALAHIFTNSPSQQEGAIMASVIAGSICEIVAFILAANSKKEEISKIVLKCLAILITIGTVFMITGFIFSAIKMYSFVK